MNKLVLDVLLKDILALMIKKSDLEVSRLRHEVNHALNILEWLFVLESEPSKPLQIAALMHDVERFFNQKRIYKGSDISYLEYKTKHQNNSAKIAEEILNELNLSEYISEVKKLIKIHEVGGTIEADILKNADSLSFFDKNLIEYYKEKGLKKTEDKVIYMHQRMSDSAKAILKDSNFDFKSIDHLSNLI